MTFDLDSYLSQARRQVDESLREYLPSTALPDPLRIREAMHYAVLDGGKRLRPCLVLAACEAVGGTRQQALGPACAIEMIHAYSLVHDDLPAMDDEALRRGKPTCHQVFGEAAGVLVGDALLTQAFEVMAAEGLRQPNNAQRILHAAFELARAAGVYGMVGGQGLDMELKAQPPSFELLERCHADKTAALFRGSTTIGALVGGGSDGQVELMRAFGFDLGLAFQHADDLRDEDFPTYQQQSLARAEELATRAAQRVAVFGAAGVPLAALAQLVLKRAQESMR